MKNNQEEINKERPLRCCPSYSNRSVLASFLLPFIWFYYFSFFLVFCWTLKRFLFEWSVRHLRQRGNALYFVVCLFIYFVSQRQKRWEIRERDKKKRKKRSQESFCPTADLLELSVDVERECRVAHVSGPTETRDFSPLHRLPSLFSLSFV